MENTENSETQIVINDEIKSYLLESSKWSKFIAIVSYVGMGILILIGVLMMFGVSFLSSLSKDAPMFLAGFIYILLAIVYYFPTTYLYRFARLIKRGVLSDDESTITESFFNMNRMFKFIGIMMIVVLSIYALIFVIAVPLALYLKSA